MKKGINLKNGINLTDNNDYTFRLYLENKKLKGLLIDILNTCNDLDIKIDELKEIKNVLHVD